MASDLYEWNTEHDCPTCKGWGYHGSDDEDCKACKGTGLKSTSKYRNDRVPGGIDRTGGDRG